MRRKAIRPRTAVIGISALLGALLLAVRLGDAGGERQAASPGELAHIAAKNREAAIEAAARMKAKSEETSRAADARLRAREAGRNGAEAAGY